MSVIVVIQERSNKAVDIGEKGQVNVYSTGMLETAETSITSIGNNNRIQVYGSVISNENHAIILNDYSSLYIAGLVRGKASAIVIGAMKDDEEINVSGSVISSEGAAIAGGARLRISNHQGTIEGKASAIHFIGGVAGNVGLEVTNVGTIRGDRGITASASNDSVVNRGTIEGRLGQAILFGAGNDSYTGTNGGTVSGIVDMGADNDVYIGGIGNETIIAGQGDDEIDGEGGYDTLKFESNNNITVNLGVNNPQNTGEGNDTIRDIENLIGRDGNDTFTGTLNENTLVGGKGNDTLDGNSGVDQLEGGDGDDLFYISDAADVLVEVDGEGDDLARTTVSYTLAGGVHVEKLQAFEGRTNIRLTGNELHNILLGNAGTNKLSGEGGGDRLYGGEGADTLDGGAGHDIVTYEYSTAAQGITLDLNNKENSTGEAEGDEFSGIEAFVGSTKGDTIIGHDTRYNELFGDRGDDTMMAGAAGDRLFGQRGSDRLYSGAGADTLMGGLENGSDPDNGYDIVSYQKAARAITLNLDTLQHTGEAKDDTFRAIDAFVGSEHNDQMIGSSGRDDFYGDAGNDSLEGGGGSDTLVGEAGGDVLYAGAGNDTIYGGKLDHSATEAWDLVSYQRAEDAIVLNFGQGQAHSGAAAGDVFHDIDAFWGSTKADIMIGSTVGDTFYGDAENDILEGAGGGDLLFGQAGDDTLTGGAGNDELHGGTGSNTAMFFGARSEYQVTRNANGSITVKDLDGSEGTDILWDVRMLDFKGAKEFFNVAPTNLTLVGNTSLVENTPPRTLVGTLSATDLDGDAITYSLAPGSSSAFAIDPKSNKLVVTGPLDFETQPIHQVTIQAKDAYGGVTSLTVNITVTDKTDETTPFTLWGTPQADVLTGEAGDDTIYGNGANDTLSGEAGQDRLYGGLGNDLLSGGAGKDVFVFDTKLNKSTNVDQIADFRYQDDSVYLENRIFTKLGAGTASKPKKFNSDMFTTGTKAQDAEDRIVYDKKSGALYYDQDGTGSKAQVKIATLTNKAVLKHSDFFVI